MAAPRVRVMLVPGGINPGEVTYRELLPYLGADVDPVVKEHELYSGANTPPPGWSMDAEVEAIVATADARGWGSFHVVGYSAGGAIALALLAARGERVASAALIEPAWIGPPSTPEELADHELMRTADPADVAGSMARIIGVPREELAEMPEWMLRRPAGLRALADDLMRRDLDVAVIDARRTPILLALGEKSAPVEHARAKRLAGALRDARIRTYRDAHHFDPPHRKMPAVFAEDLRALWTRGA